MPAVSDRQAVGVLKGGGSGDAVAPARTNAGDVRNGEQRQAGPGTVGAGDSEFFAEVADIPVSAAVLVRLTPTRASFRKEGEKM